VIRCAILRRVIATPHRGGMSGNRIVARGNGSCRRYILGVATGIIIGVIHTSPDLGPNCEELVSMFNRRGGRIRITRFGL
jgi:hypothetical protein